MKRIIVALSAAAALWIAAGCGSDPCTDACEKIKSCASGLDCTKLDPSKQLGCNLTKSTFGQANCSATSGNCTGQAQSAAEAINSCTLDPQTCACAK